MISKACVSVPCPASSSTAWHVCWRGGEQNEAELSLPPLWSDGDGLMRGRWLCQRDRAPSIPRAACAIYSPHLLFFPCCAALRSLRCALVSWGIRRRCGECGSAPRGRASGREVMVLNSHRNLCYTVQSSCSHTCLHPTS